MFVDWHDLCGEGSYGKQVAIDGKACFIEMVEFSSDLHTYSMLWETWVRAVNGIIMVYSIDSRSSFMRVRAFHHQIIQILIKKGGNVDDFPLFLVGNKRTI